MVELFTDDARRLIVHAQEEAQSLNHAYIGTEHPLLGLLRYPETTGAEHAVLALFRESDGIAGRALFAQGANPATAPEHGSDMAT